MTLQDNFASDALGRQWNLRINRARELRQRCRPASDILLFYEKALGFQCTVSGNANVGFDPETPLREQIDLACASRPIVSLLALTATDGPEALQVEAARLQQARAEVWIELLRSELTATMPAAVSAGSFFARGCLQPLMERLQIQSPAPVSYSQSVCPACGGLPQLAVLRQQGHGASRWLQCSCCFREWLFRRFVCPWCGEEDHEKLPRYSTEDYQHVHVEACDSCRRYLKSIDMTVDGRAIPLVDEVSVAVLDVWAADRSYVKIMPNLMGF